MKPPLVPLGLLGRLANALDLVLSAARQLPIGLGALGSAIIGLVFVTMLDRHPELRAAKDLYPLFEGAFPLVAVFLAAGVGARDVEDRTAETILTYPLGFPRLLMARAVAVALVAAVPMLLGAIAARAFYIDLDPRPLFLASFAPGLILAYVAVVAGTVTRSTIAGAAVALAWWAAEFILKGVSGHCNLLFASACASLGRDFMLGRLYLIAAALPLPFLAAAWATDPERVYRTRQ